MMYGADDLVWLIPSAIFAGWLLLKALMLLSLWGISQGVYGLTGAMVGAAGGDIEYSYRMIKRGLVAAGVTGVILSPLLFL